MIKIIPSAVQNINYEQSLIKPMMNMIFYLRKCELIVSAN